MAGNTGVVRSPIVVLLLSIVTFDIYHIVWWYKVQVELRDCTPDPTLNPGTRLLILLFVPIANVVVYFNTVKYIRRLQEARGVPERVIGPWAYFFLAIFTIGIANSFIVQGALNRVWEAS